MKFGVLMGSSALALTMALTSCGSETDASVPSAANAETERASESASTEESEEATAPSAGEGTPKSDAGESGTSIYYLAAAPGCYSMTEDGNADPLIDGIGKELFVQDCSDPHSFEVFWSGSVDGFDAQVNLTQEDAQNVCVAEYINVFSQEPPSEIVPLEEQADTPYVYWFFPDDGLEAETYPGRLVCGIFLANDDYTRMLSRTGSLVLADI